MNKLALLTAAGAALMMIGGTALAQTNGQQPSTMGAQKSHMGNPDATKAKDAKKKGSKDKDKPATRNGELPKGGKNKSGM